MSADAQTDGGTSLPPSARYVRAVIDEHEPIGFSAIQEETEMPPSTLKDALGTLVEHGEVLKARDPADLRRVQYLIRP